MPSGIDPSPAPPSSDRLTELRAILDRHDLDRLELFTRYVDSLPPGVERLSLVRAIAVYEDQRGWRVKAQARFTDLLQTCGADPRARARILIDLAETSMRWTDLAQMRRSLEEARAELVRSPDDELQAYLLRGEALLACLQHDLPSAKVRMQQALDCFTELGDWPGTALCLNGMSYICLNGKQWDEAVGYTRQGLKGDQNALNLRLRGDLLSNHGFALRRLRGNRVALPWVEDAYQLRLDQRDPLMASRTGVNLAEILRALGRLTEAAEILHRGLEDLRSIGMEEQAGSVANTLGALRFTQGDYAGAAIAYDEALRYAQALGETKLEGVICANQAEVFYQWGDFRTAANWYMRCAEVNAAQGDLTKAVDCWLQAARLITWVDPHEIHPILGRALERVEQETPGDPDVAELAGQIQREVDLLGDSTVSRPELRIQPRPIRLGDLPPLPAAGQIATVDDDLARLVDELLTFSAAPWLMDRFSERLQAVLDAGRLASPPARAAAHDRLAAGIDSQPPRAPTPPQVGGLQLGTDVEFSSYLALICGGLAEAGADPATAIAPLRAAFARTLPLALEFKVTCGADMEEILERPDPKTLRAQAAGLDFYAARLPSAARAWNSLRGYCLGAIALLARAPEGRREFRCDFSLRDQITRLVSDCPELSLLEELLAAPDGETMLVIHPGLKRGYRVRVNGVTGNFQLHTLLAYLLVGDPQGGWLPGVRPNRRIMAAERGTLVPWETLIAQSIFNMVSWRGIQPDGSLSGDPATWILGESRPSDIPRFEGQWTLLMGPLPYQRAWTAGPKFPGLQAECILEEILSQAEVERIIERMIKKSKDEGGRMKDEKNL